MSQRRLACPARWASRMLPAVGSWTPTLLTNRRMSRTPQDQDKRTREGRWTTTLIALVAVVLLAACGGEYPGSTIAPKTDIGETVQALYVSVFWWCMFILVIVWSVMAWVMIRFRERPGQPEPRQIHGHMGLEIAWTILPAIIVVAIAIPTVQAVFATQRPPGDDALLIEVTGHRYWWEFEYPELDVATANELHVPVGRPVSLRLASDVVIHSFWVPMLGGKRDANPLRATVDGEEPRYNWYYFTLNEEGEFIGQCAEFCGQSHALMGIKVIAESEAAFGAWAERMNEPSPTAAPPAPDAPPALQEDPLVAQGRDIFMGSTCVACHSIEGTTAAGVLGPNLTRLGEHEYIAAGMLENTPENLFRWIRDPASVKPDARMPATDREAKLPVGQGIWPATGLSEDQVRAVAAYLSSLR